MATQGKRQFNLNLLFAAMAMLALSCGIVRFAMLYRQGELLFLGLSALGSSIGGLIGLLAKGRNGFKSGAAVGFVIVAATLLSLLHHAWSMKY